MRSPTSEAATNVAFQAAPPRPARAALDQAPGNGIFASLVDNNPASASTQPAPTRRSDSDNAPPTDDNRPRDVVSATPSANDNQASGDNATAPQPSDADAGNAAQQPSGTKPAEKPTPDDTPSASSTDAAATDAAPAGAISPAAPNPIAVMIPAAAAIVTAPAAPAPSSGNAAAPLAIAAAALAASTIPAAAAASGRANPDPNVAATTTAIAGDAANQAAGATDAATMAPAGTTIPSKSTAVKTPAATKAAVTAASDARASAAGHADPAANSAQPPSPATKPDGVDGSASAAEADGAANSATTASTLAPAHEHAAETTIDRAPAGSADAVVQAAVNVAPQLPPAPAIAQPTGALTAAVATHAGVPLSGLAVEIAASAKNGKSSFEIRLDPADLGRIDVRIDVDRNGQMTSHLTVEKPETLSMLQQDAPQLQRALHDAGFKTGDGGLQFSLRDQSSSNQNGGNWTGRHAQRLVVSNEDALPPVTAGQTYGRLLGSSSGVDIKV